MVEVVLVVVAREARVRDVPEAIAEAHREVRLPEQMRTHADVRRELPFAAERQVAERRPEDALAELDVRHERAAGVVAPVEEQGIEVDLVLQPFLVVHHAEQLDAEAHWVAVDLGNEVEDVQGHSRAERERFDGPPVRVAVHHAKRIGIEDRAPCARDRLLGETRPRQTPDQQKRQRRPHRLDLPRVALFCFKRLSLSRERASRMRP